jgi:methionyl-tRNA synthetase
MSEKNLFFKMSKYQDWLMGYIRAHPGFILPESRRNEVLGFLDNNKLEDLCVTRPKAKLIWGIECPLNPEYVTYVWFDALINYISACGYPKTNEWWPADVHIVGKDILRQHAVFWPIILKALGLDPPRLVFAHGWWVQDKAKMSKSLGNVVDPLEVAAEFGVDGYRYFLLKEVPFGHDGTYSREAVTLRYNTDLANDLGNLFYRTLTMMEKYYGGTIRAGGARGAKHALRDSARGLAGRMEKAMDRLQYHEALGEVWALINAANKFIEDRAPWVLAKQKNDAELLEVMGSLCEILRIVAQAISPFIPATAEKMWAALGLPPADLLGPSFALVEWDYFKKDTPTRKGDPFFPRKDQSDPSARSLP